ncbi:MAG: MBL fold metallo-hydrolase, partial [Candidatus Hydrogenedentales bacterium]
PLMDVNPMLHLVVPAANHDFVCKRLGCDPAWPIRIDASETLDVADLEFTAVPAAHEDVERDSEGHCRYLGYVVRCGQWTVYHSGDTVLYDGMEVTLRKFKIDLAILPINGRKPERRVAGNLNGEEAAKLAKAIDARLVVPCHYDMFAFNTESPDLFERTCKELDQPYKILKAGERLTI